MAEAELDDKDAELLNLIRSGHLVTADPEDIKRLASGALIRDESGRIVLTPLGDQMLRKWFLNRQRGR